MTIAADDLAAAGLDSLFERLDEAVLAPERRAGGADSADTGVRSGPEPGAVGSDADGEGGDGAGTGGRSGGRAADGSTSADDEPGADADRNVAVVAEPYAGRSALFDYLERRLDESDRVSFDGVVDELPSLGGSEVVLVEDCQYLYTREVDGFDVLDRFLARIAVSESQFVAGWNRYAWEYLTAVRDVDDLFPTVVEVPALDAGQVADLLLSRTPSMPEFVETGAAGRVKTVDVDWHAPEVGERRLPVSVPVPELNSEYLTSLEPRRTGAVEDESAQTVVFQKIAALSNGNPGVATTLWERSRRDGAIAPEYVDGTDLEGDLDDEAAFVLEVLLAKGRLSLSTLAAVLDQLPVQRLVQALVDRGVVRVDGGTVAVDPEALHVVVDRLHGRRLVW